MKLKKIEPECHEIIENIKLTMRKKGISQFDLALDADLSHSNVYYILSGRCLPSLNSLVKIAKALNVHMQEIIGNISMDWRLD